MTYDGIVVKVGQVWWAPNISDRTTTITKIAGGKAYYKNSRGEEREWGPVKEDGTPEYWDDGWQLKTVATKSSGYQDDMDFFKAVSPGCCPCNIAKVDCWIHR